MSESNLPFTSSAIAALLLFLVHGTRGSTSSWWRVTRVLKTRARRAELEKIAAEIDADIVYLPRGEYAEEPEAEGRKGRRHRRERDED